MTDGKDPRLHFGRLGPFRQSQRHWASRLPLEFRLGERQKIVYHPAGGGQEPFIEDEKGSRPRPASAAGIFNSAARLTIRALCRRYWRDVTEIQLQVEIRALHFV